MPATVAVEETSSQPVATEAAPETTSRAPGTPEGDLDLLLESLERYHPDPFHGIDRPTFVAALGDLRASLASIAPEEAMVELMRLWAALGSDGGEGHQLVAGPGDAPVLPLRLYQFDDGVFVTDALDADLVGARLVAVEGRPIEEVVALVATLVPGDSPATVPGFWPWFFLKADVLQGLGVIASDDAVELTLDREGVVGDVVVEMVPLLDHVAWAGMFGLVHLPEGSGLRYLDDGRLLWTDMPAPGMLYVRHREILSLDLAAVIALREAVASPDVERVILDLRHNPGGNNQTYRVVRDILVDAPQPLTILVDRHTFSAATNLATELEQSREVTFAGEASGGAPNHWGDARYVRLEHFPIPLEVGIATRYWQKSTPDDPRWTLEPHIEVPMTSADFFSAHDRLLEVIIADET